MNRSKRLKTNPETILSKFSDEILVMSVAICRLNNDGDDHGGGGNDDGKSRNGSSGNRKGHKKIAV